MQVSYRDWKTHELAPFGKDQLELIPRGFQRNFVRFLLDFKLRATIKGIKLSARLDLETKEGKIRFPQYFVTHQTNGAVEIFLGEEDLHGWFSWWELREKYYAAGSQEMRALFLESLRGCLARRKEVQKGSARESLKKARKENKEAKQYAAVLNLVPRK